MKNVFLFKGLDSEQEDERPRLSVSADDWVMGAFEVYIAEHGIHLDVGADTFFQGARNIDRGDLEQDLRRHIRVGKRKLNKDQSEGVVRDFIHRERERKRLELLARLMDAPRTSDAALRAWCAQLFPEDTEAEEFENRICILKQWMWQVGKAVAGEKQQWHVMPIFWGPQGGGKSFQIQRLISPIAPFALNQTFRVFMGQFDALPMSTNYVLNLDEMGGVKHSEANRVKECISADYLAGRKIHSQHGHKLMRTASFIASSNDPPPHGLVDMTGARRFYSLKCRGGRVDGARAEFFNIVDPLDFWHCVDYKGEAPIKARLEAIAQVQNVINRTQSPLERFIDDECNPTEGEHEELKTLQAAYSEYCRRTRLHVPIPSQKQLETELVALGYEIVNHAGVKKVYNLKLV